MSAANVGVEVDAPVDARDTSNARVADVTLLVLDIVDECLISRIVCGGRPPHTLAVGW
jgi:hypothetical protein